MKFVTGIISLCLAFTLGASSVYVKKCSTAPVIDGRIGQKEWNGFKIPLSFKTFRTNNAAKDPSHVWMSYDKDHLYIALSFRDFDTKGGKNVIWHTPRTEIFLGTKKKHIQIMHNIHNEIFPKGAKWFRSKSSFQGKNWMVEFAIPRSMIHFDRSSRIFQGNVIRAGSENNSMLFPILSTTFHAPEEYGTFFLGSPSQILQDRLAEVEKEYGRKVALSSKTITEKELSKALAKIDRFVSLQKKQSDEAFIRSLAGKGKRLWVTAPYARTFPVSDNWKARRFFGKEFWVHLIPSWDNTFLQKGSPTDIPFFREAFYDLRHWDSKGDYLDFLINADPEKSAYGIVLKKTKQPFSINSSCSPFHRPEQWKYSGESVKRFMRLYSSRFGGMFSDESAGNMFSRQLDRLKIPHPKSRKEALKTLEKLYQMEDVTAFRNWAVGDPALKALRSTGTATWLDHQILEFGDRMSGTEIGGPAISYMAMQMAFSRGAGRQYGRPWRTYVATHDSDAHLKYPCKYSINASKMFKFPHERKILWGNVMLGDQVGITREDYDSFYIYPYMSGTNMIFEESAHHHTAAGFDHRTIAKEDPLAVNLRERQLHVSEITSRYIDFYDNVIRKRSRGTAFTPVGMLWSHDHGILKSYSSLIWDLFEYTEGDNQIWGIVKACFPDDRKIYYDHIFKRCPFGDIFDVITTRASAKVLNSYPVLLLCGNIPWDKKLAADVTDYVRQGGTLVVNIEQVRNALHLFPAGFFGTDLTSVSHKKASGSFSMLSRKVIQEKFAFKFARVKPFKNSEVLAFTADQDRFPLLLGTSYGRGRVVLSTPLWLKEAYSQNMLRLFDDMMKRITEETLPVKVQCGRDIEYTVNRTETSWVIGLYNHYGTGYKRTAEDPSSKVDPAEKRIVTVTASFPIRSSEEWLTGKKVPFKGKTLTVTVPPGGIRLLELSTE